MLFQLIKEDKLNNPYYSEKLVETKNFKLLILIKFFSIFNQNFNENKISKEIYWKSSDKKLHGNFDISYKFQPDLKYNHISIKSLDSNRSLPFIFINQNNTFSSFWIK